MSYGVFILFQRLIKTVTDRSFGKRQIHSDSRTGLRQICTDPRTRQAQRCRYPECSPAPSALNPLDQVSAAVVCSSDEPVLALGILIHRAGEVEGLLQYRFGTTNTYKKGLTRSNKAILQAKDELFVKDHDTRAATQGAARTMQLVCNELGPLLGELVPLVPMELRNGR